MRARLPSLVAVSLAAHVALAAALTHHARAARPTPTAPASGETYELPTERLEEPPADPAEAPLDPSPVAVAAPPSPPSPQATGVAAPPAPSVTVTRSPAASRPSSSGTSASASPSAAPSLFGAVGVRYAVDLFSTFTRALPQVTMEDKAWASLPLGPVGAADVTIEIDDAGHLAPSSITFAGAPPAVLRAASTRALAMVSGHAFTARSARSHLSVAAVVSAASNEDEFHGTRVALSGVAECTGYVCKPFFAQPGRRVDFTVRLIP